MEGEQPQDSEYLNDEGTLNPDLLIIFEYAQYICLILSIFGFMLNSYVLVRLIAKAYANVELFVDGSGLPLATMAVADLLSLLLVFLIIIFGSQELSQSTILIPCKVSTYFIFVMHSW